MEGFNIPILFIIFNRLDTTERVFDEIRKQKPKYLYVAADGPRKNREDDIINCKKTRAIIEKIDWECELKTLFRDENLGCGKAVSGAITWFFENVEMGIILEDDCLPHQDFFPYCEDLLERYKDNIEIKIISGDNFQNGIKRGDASYYFSAYSHIWGWASWRRTWLEYDYEMRDYFSFLQQRKINDIFTDQDQQIYFLNILRKTYNKKYDTWDYQFGFSIWNNNGKCLLPNLNLISNIGFGNNGTHTTINNNKVANLPIKRLSFPLIHPSNTDIDKEADYYTYKNTLYLNLRERVLIKIKSLLHK